MGGRLHRRFYNSAVLPLPRLRTKRIVDNPLPASGLVIPTVTANPALGRTIFVPTVVLGRRTAVRDRVLTASGKGVDASLVLHQWGATSVVLGFTAGEGGLLHDRMLRARGVETDWVWVQGETRTNVIVVAADDSRPTTFADDTLTVTPADEDELVRRFDRRLEGADAAAVGGPLPGALAADLYVRLLETARRRPVPVVLDAFGPGVERWLMAGPAWVKPNRHELELLIGYPVRGPEDALAAAAAIHARTGVGILVSLDEEGAVAAAEGLRWRVPPVSVPVVSAEGAGDAMVAGMAVAVARGLSVADTLRLSTAAAAAAVMQPGVGECDPRDVARLIEAVQVEQA